MRKIRKRKLNHLITNIPSTIPQIFQSSRRVNIQLGNKAGNYEKKLHLYRAKLQYTQNTTELTDCFEFKVSTTKRF